MIDFSAVNRGEKKLADLQDQLTHADIIDAVNEMIDTQLALIDGATDDYVTFVPEDPDAFDGAAATEEEKHMAWTLGHVIVHVTATGEEGASAAALLARGTEITGRSRYEVHWTTMQSIDQVIHRLEESRRMRLGYLNAWPDEPHLDNVWRKIEERIGAVNAIGRMLFSLKHDADHLGQIEDIMNQARAHFG